MVLKKYIIYILYAFLPFVLIAQRSEVKIGSFHYYIHTVEKNQTLSSIALSYDVTVNNIKDANPNLKNLDKIKSDQKILIPNFDDFRGKYPSKEWDFVLFKVDEKEKLKSIAKRFNIEVDDIKRVNPGVENKPKIGTELLIPQKAINKKIEIKQNPATDFEWNAKNVEEKKDSFVEKSLKEERSDCIDFKYNPKSNVFSVALTLPFNPDGSRNDYSIYFVEGVLLAAEEMKNQGLSFNINVLDIATKKLLHTALESDALKKADLIIGPFSFSSTTLTALAEFANSNKKPIVSPYDYKGTETANRNPFFIQIYPSEDDSFRKFIRKIPKEANVILVYSGTTDSILLDDYKRNLDKELRKYQNCIHKMGQQAASTELHSLLSNDRENIIVVCSENQIFVSDLLDRIRSYRINFNVRVFGRASWAGFKSIDPARYFDSNLNIIQPFYVDTNNPDVKAFIHKYRMNYNNEPHSPYSYLGYDITFCFLSLLKKFGPDFLNCMSDYSQTLLQSNLLFNKVEGGGYINTGAFLLEFTPEAELLITELD